MSHDARKQNLALYLPNPKFPLYLPDTNTNLPQCSNINCCAKSVPPFDITLLIKLAASESNDDNTLSRIEIKHMVHSKTKNATLKCTCLNINMLETNTVRFHFNPSAPTPYLSKDKVPALPTSLLSFQRINAL